DTIYIFSDGYKDQYGGPRNKKFMAKRFRQLFIDIQRKSINEQKEVLNKTIEDWKGDIEQIDDILVIGVRI
ncbi:MAG: histidine kinase, partial [Bacteroidetes bacterium]|nr:histidine kinase [Bacteroidota bacterium]